MSEYMDVVNEHDQVIGQDTRTRIHQRHKIHRGVHVFVVNRLGELLLQRRALTTHDYPGYWDASVGGQVAAGETYEQAGVRELEEELGCRAERICLIAKYDSFSTRQREKRALFVYGCEGPFRLAPQVAEVRFARAAEITQMMRSERFTEGFERSFSRWLTVRDGG